MQMYLYCNYIHLKLLVSMRTLQLNECLNIRKLCQTVKQRFINTSNLKKYSTNLEKQKHLYIKMIMNCYTVGAYNDRVSQDSQRGSLLSSLSVPRTVSASDRVHRKKRYINVWILYNTRY